MAELVDQLLEQALISEMKESEFWELSFGEVVRHIKAYSKRQTEQIKLRAVYDYKLASATAAMISTMFSSSPVSIEFEDVYPEFKEKVKKIEEPVVDKRTQLNVARFMEFAKNHNKKRKQVVEQSI